jgi:trigger factor
VTFPEDYGAEALAGKAASFAVTVGEIKSKVLPELTDDFAAEVAGFDTLAELREDIAAKLAEQERQAIEVEFREAVVDAAVAEATVEVPEPLTEARAREMWQRLVATLERQGISKEAYLQISQKDEDESLAEAKPEAEQALKREAVIAAVAEAEGIEPTEEQLLEALEHSAEHEETTAAKLLERLRGSGRLDALKQDLAARQAVDFLAEHAEAISVEKAQAKGKLWTPGDEEKAASGAGLWTPGT